MYVMSLQVHSYASHIFVVESKTSKRSTSLKSAGTNSQMLGRRKPNDLYHNTHL